MKQWTSAQPDGLNFRWLQPVWYGDANDLCALQPNFATTVPYNGASARLGPCHAMCNETIVPCFLVMPHQCTTAIRLHHRVTRPLSSTHLYSVAAGQPTAHSPCKCTSAKRACEVCNLCKPRNARAYVLRGRPSKNLRVVTT